jgi:hypothetical protein
MRITIEIRRPGWLGWVWLKRARPLVLLLALVFAAPVLAIDRFTDVGPGPHHDDISAIAAAGITQGCNPPENTLYCPADFVRRDQMGSFLARVAGLGANPPVANADQLDGADSTDFQLRVTGSCAEGSAVSTVNADGSVGCEPDDVDGGDADTLDGVDSTGFYAAGSKVADSNLLDGLDSSAFARTGSPDGRPGFARSIVDANDSFGFASIAIGADGLGLISYWGTPGGLRVAHCANVPCSTASTALLDTTFGIGAETSITIGADGLGLISYRHGNNGDLKVAQCNDVACSSASASTLDAAGDVGYASSVTIGADGLGLISYWDGTSGSLKVAHCANTACSAASIATLDSPGGVAFSDTSITIGADGLGLISYRDIPNGDLKVAHCADVACSTASTATLDGTGDVGYHNSITIGTDGLGLISYWNGTNADLKVAHCADTACSTASIATLHGTGFVGHDTAITIGADGLGLISYYDDADSSGSNTDDLKVAHCNDVACSTASAATLDSTGNVGRFTSITIGADGLGLISYYDFTNGDLKVAHLSNRLGVPWHRPR